MAYDIDFKMELVVEVLGGRSALESKNNSETKSELKKLKKKTNV